MNTGDRKGESRASSAAVPGVAPAAHGPSGPQREPRRVLVTGASRGIGLAITTRLLRSGWYVTGVSRQAHDIAKGLDADHVERFHPLAIDLGDLATLPRALDRARDELAALDAVVLNAGRGDFGGIEELSASRIEELIAINLVSPILLARSVVPHLKRRGGGDIVVIGSEAALQGRRKGSVYCATKFGLRGFAQALRDECASSNVRVSIVHPGMVRTTFFDALDFEPGEDEANAILPEDVADAVALILEARRGTVIDEIILSPLKKVVRARKREE